MNSLAAIRYWFQPTRVLRWQFLALAPWIVPIATYLMLGPAYLSNWNMFIGATTLNLGLLWGCLLVLDRLSQSVTSRYSGLDQSGKRFVLVFSMFTIVTPIFVLGGLWAYTHFHLFGYEPKAATIPRILILNLIANIVSAGAFESLYSLGKWRENMLEKEELKKSNLQSQYESLKNQVNPHFLFNTLNSLSSLIEQDPGRAEAFVNELSKVYRYLLQTNQNTVDADGELTTLTIELDFIQSYFHLLKTRYRAGIELKIDVDPTDKTSLLPPLTLQMLVENAVKHSVIHANKPLLIEIKSYPDSYLLVRNNRQPRTVRADRRPMPGTKIGLSNIRAKYHLLANMIADTKVDIPREIIIEETETHFSLYLPLLKHIQK
jgi:two-component system LytT family sensor kinase